MSPRTVEKRSSNYHSPLRARQAAETRRSVLYAALELFATTGWTTTLPAIAARAGVSVDTIYAVFKTKSALLMEVVEVAIVGDDEEAAMADRPDFAVIGRGRRPERIRAGVRYSMDVYGRSVAILRTLREAAASDAAARERWARYGDDRRTLMAAGLELILKAEPSDELVDALWAIVSPEVFSALIEERGWSPDRVEDLLVDQVKAAIDRF